MREDWIEIELNQVCDKAKKVKRNDMPSDESFIYLDIGGIDNHSNRIIDHKIYQWREAPSRAQQIVQVGDVLFSTVRTYLKNIAQVSNPKYQGQICSSGFTVIRGKKGILNPKYVFYYSIFEGFLQPLNELQTGTSYPAVRDNDVFAQKILIAPLPEQRSIVAKIEQLFSELDNGIANLKAAKDKLEIYRQAVLKKAFEGELTKEWREKNNITSDWDTMPLKDIGDWKGGGTPSKGKPEYWDNGTVLWVSPKDMKTEVINSTIDRITEESIENSSAKWIEKGAILIVVRSGIIRRMLPVAIAGQDLTVNQDLQTIKPNDAFISEFVFWFLKANDRDIRENCAKDGTTVDNINVPVLKKYKILVPYLEEQTQIVQEIESRLSVCDNILANIEEGLDKSEALRQSILKQAFEGKLLSLEELEACRNEPDWESAEQLLALIKNEKMATT